MSAVFSKTPMRYGLLSRMMKDHIYYIPKRGQIFTTPWIDANVTMRFFGVIALSARRAPFDVRTDSRLFTQSAVAIKPSIERRFTAEDVQLVSFHLDPRDPYFRRFRAIPDAGVLSLDRNAFAHLDPALEAAYRGELSVREATDLHCAVVQIAARYLPGARPPDWRSLRAVEMLRSDPHLTLDELADAAGLSYDRMSHFFSESVGLPLRSFLLWQKLHAVHCMLASGSSLTACAHAAGFTDSAHLSRTFLQVYGAPPSYFLDRRKVKVFSEPSTSSRRVSADARSQRFSAPASAG